MTTPSPSGIVRAGMVAAGLVCCVLAVFAVVEGVAALAGGRPGTWAWLGAAVLLAVVVPLVRPGLDRLGDRAAYGRGGDPTAVLAEFVQRISETLAVDDVLPQLARTAVQATRSSSGGVRLWLADGQERHETWPPNAAEASHDEVSLVLEHAGERVGSLAVMGADEELRDVDRELLGRLAGPAGLAVSNVRLTLELRRRLAQTTALSERVELSRQRLLETGRDQRRRFVVAVQRRVLAPLDAVDGHLAADANGRSPALAAAERDALASLEELRDLASGVFPPALAERGVGAALSLRVANRGEPVVVHDEAGRNRYPPVVESGAYFCCAALVEDLAAVAPLTIELGGSAAGVSFRAGAQAPLSTSVEQLVRDRVEALGGTLRVSKQAGQVDVRGSISVDGDTLPAVLAQLEMPATSDGHGGSGTT